MEVMIEEIFDEAEGVVVYNDGAAVRCLPGQPSYKLVISGFKNMLVGARKMPAFGVSLDNETREAMHKGVWVELEFGKIITYDDMSFEKLLLQVVAEHSGFNLIRYNSESGYSGRCYYFDINGNMSEFYNILQTV